MVRVGYPKPIRDISDLVFLLINHRGVNIHHFTPRFLQVHVTCSIPRLAAPARLNSTPFAVLPQLSSRVLSLSPPKQGMPLIAIGSPRTRGLPSCQ